MKISIAFVAPVITLLCASSAQADVADDCHVGAYRLTDSRIIDVAPSDPNPLRWRAFNGETGGLLKNADGTWTSTLGWTGRPDGRTVSFSDCATGNIRFDGTSGHRIDLHATETVFESHGTKLVGRLVLPNGSSPVPVVVLIHGSEDNSALRFHQLARLLPAEGVGVFVYDKRGTGTSGGTYTQDFDLLADDAVAAMRDARRLAGARAGRIGYQGGSEGGWVAPLAANRAPVDFVIVSFGLAVNVLQEDQEELALEMSLKGHSAEETAKALEVARAAETVAESRFTRGFAEFDAVRAKYKSEPWYKDVHGNFTYLLLPYTDAQLHGDTPLKKIAAATPFRYDPMPTLRASTTPQLWVLGADDLEAPSAETSRRIKSLIGEGHPFTLAVYPGAEHGMTEFEIGPDGERVSTRYAPDYFAMMRDFARDGRLQDAYGKSTITRGTARSP
jgi:pimeloyl-ACP methyl ester carboxylesterase